MPEFGNGFHPASSPRFTGSESLPAQLSIEERLELSIKEKLDSVLKDPVKMQEVQDRVDAERMNS